MGCNELRSIKNERRNQEDSLLLLVILLYSPLNEK